MSPIPTKNPGVKPRPRIERKILKKSSPEALQLLDQIDWQTGHLKRHLCFFGLGQMPEPDEQRRQLFAALTRRAAVEIASVSSGRKPLFHEDFSRLEPEDLKAAMTVIENGCPNGIEARIEEGHVYVYNPELLKGFLQPCEALWPQVLRL